ncbi:uncharacterized protein LOC141607901 [Silene latifolia]|uniref:uncharacterized protein LOC141607901 n=1 Tax=Silene latifolia TaxID=37657 RepID=UPI003D77CCAA
MGFSKKDLQKKTIPLVGFGETANSLGEIVIPTYARGINKQALADFVSDFSTAIQNLADKEILTLKGDKEAEVWQMHIDGASNQRGAGVGLILRSPHGDLIAQAFRCEFKATNNETEYEALLLGMQLALELGVRNLEVYGDSLLIVNHMNDEYVARDSKMIAYLKVVKELKQKFKDCKLK